MVGNMPIRLSGGNIPTSHAISVSRIAFDRFNPLNILDDANCSKITFMHTFHYRSLVCRAQFSLVDDTLAEPVARSLAKIRLVTFSDSMHVSC